MATVTDSNTVDTMICSSLLNLSNITPIVTEAARKPTLIPLKKKEA
jgi:hypothetical protein